MDYFFFYNKTNDIISAIDIQIREAVFVRQPLVFECRKK